MDHDLLSAIDQAWQRLTPRLLANPAEILRRLDHRRALLSRPPRAACLALRASDTRISPYHFPINPTYCDWYSPYTRRHVYLQHTVTLNAPALRQLTLPVVLTPPGQPWTEVADLLGVDKSAIRAAIARGLFTVHRIKHLDGKRGPGVPLVFTRQILDPQSYPLGVLPNEEWAPRFRYLADHIPDDLAATLTRVPAFRPRHGQEFFRGWRWLCPTCQCQTLRLFHPLIITQFIPNQIEKRLNQLNLQHRLKTQYTPTPIPRNPDTPIPLHAPPQLPTPYSPPGPPSVPSCLRAPVPSAHASVPTAFHCAKCLRINNEPNHRAQGWNCLIAHLTAGLLFGREVQKPAWYTPRRRHAYNPRPKCRTSKRQQQIFHCLLSTNLTPNQIAQKLHIPAIHTHIQRILNYHNVKTKEQLRAQLLPQLTNQIRSAG